MPNLSWTRSISRSISWICAIKASLRSERRTSCLSVELGMFVSIPYCEPSDRQCKSKLNLRLKMRRLRHGGEDAAGHHQHAAGQRKRDHPQRRNRRQSEHLDQNKAATVGQNVGERTRQRAHSHQNERTQKLTCRSRGGQLLQNARGKAVILDVKRSFLQPSIQPILFDLLVHLLAQTAKVFFNFSRPRNTFVLTVPSGMSSARAASSCDNPFWQQSKTAERSCNGSKLRACIRSCLRPGSTVWGSCSACHCSSLMPTSS